jgi:hypothetical protein
VMCIVLAHARLNAHFLPALQCPPAPFNYLTNPPIH